MFRFEIEKPKIKLNKSAKNLKLIQEEPKIETDLDVKIPEIKIPKIEKEQRLNISTDIKKPEIDLNIKNIEHDEKRR